MIIVIKKADFETQPFSNLKTTAKRKTIIAINKKSRAAKTETEQQLKKYQ